MTTCDRCGKELEIGDFPFCKGDPSGHTPGRFSVIGDEIPGGVEIKHGLCNPDGSPRRFDSKSAIAKAAREAGMTNYVTHNPPPGTDKSKHTTRWI